MKDDKLPDIGQVTTENIDGLRIRITAILANTIPGDLGISRLIDGLPYSWKQQQQKFGC